MDSTRRTLSSLLVAALNVTVFPSIAVAADPTPSTPSARVDGNLLACTQYVADGSGWHWYYNEWSLKIIPTSCGRQIGTSETPMMFYEIVQKFGDPEKFGSPPDAVNDRWKNAKGMMNQLTCHLVIARNKPEWNLEPYRPWVGHDATVAADCNPYIK